MSQKPEITASIEVKDNDVVNTLNTLGQQMDKPTPDMIAGVIADQVVREYINALRQNGSVVTGTGIQSIESVHFGTGVYGVMIARYLDAVDEGTSGYGKPPPVDNNHRLQSAANSYGMNPYQLSKSIGDSGTDAHPFKKEALEKVESKMNDLVAQEVEDAVQNL